MLQVDWWGALLLIWAAICYAVLLKSTTFRWTLDTVSLHLSYLTAAAVVVGYFNPLGAAWAKQVYVGIWAVCALAIVTNHFAPEPSGDAPDAAAPAAATATASEEDEEHSVMWSIVGESIALGPIVLAVVLGGIKSFGLAQTLGWLA